MSDRVEILENGMIVTTIFPSFAMMQKPSYGDWLGFLYRRGAAVEFTDGRKADGSPRRVIEVIKERTSGSAQVATLSNDSITIPCICCGIEWDRMGMDKIRIGGFVRMPEEDQISSNEIIRRTVVKPVSKMGLGCPTCQDLFFKEVVRTTTENDARAEVCRLRGIYKLLVDKCNAGQRDVPIGKCKHGIPIMMCAECMRFRPANEQVPLLEVKMPSPLLPWINIFELGVK